MGRFYFGTTLWTQGERELFIILWNKRVSDQITYEKMLTDIILICKTFFNFINRKGKNPVLSRSFMLSFKLQFIILAFFVCFVIIIVIKFNLWVQRKLFFLGELCFSSRPLVNFTIILRAAFTRADPKSTKKTVNSSSFFRFWDLFAWKLRINTLMKLTPDRL